MNKPSCDMPRVFTVRETAAQMRISRNTAYREIREGHIPHLRFGRRIVVPMAALNKMLGCGSDSDDGGQS